MFPYRSWLLQFLAVSALLLSLQGATCAQHGYPPDSLPAIEKASHERDSDDPWKVLVVYIVDMLSNLDGGVRRHGETLGNLNLVLDYDTPWNGGFHAYLLGNHGGSFSQHVGDFQVVSHIEAPPSMHLFEAYYLQKFFEDRLSFLVGLYAVDSEFDTRASSSLFLHSSPGTGGDLGQIGRHGPAIFPVGALGGRVRYEDEGWYGQLAAVEGVPGDPEDPFGVHLRLDKHEGLFLIGEVGREWSDEHGALGKAAFGAWGFTAPFETHLAPETSAASNRGAYLSLEKTFSREQDDPDQGLAGYLRVGVADGRINPIATFAGAGLVYTGAFSGRDHDRLGFAVNTGFAGGDFLASGKFDSHETALELTYSFAVSENFSIQPDLQYVMNPGFRTELDNSLVFGLRAVFQFEDG